MEFKGSISGIFEAAREISQQRRELLEKLRDALLHNDQENIIRFARELCGLTNEQKSNRAN